MLTQIIVAKIAVIYLFTYLNWSCEGDVSADGLFPAAVFGPPEEHGVRVRRIWFSSPGWKPNAALRVCEGDYGLADALGPQTQAH